MRRLALAALLLLPLGCSRANRAAMHAWGCPHHVTLWSCGTKVGEWESAGKVENEGQSDGYYFRDKATGRFVTISGTVEITVEPDCR